MEWRPFDMTVISADAIKNVNLYYPMDVYVEVSIFGYAKNKKKTFVDKKGGTTPKWNHPMKFTLDEPSLTKPDLSLFFRLRSNRFFGDKDVGMVTIPIQELFTHSNSNDDGSSERVVEYQVFTTGTRKPKGTLKFAYKFGKKFAHTQQHINGYPALPPLTGYPPTHMPPVWCGTSSTTYQYSPPGGGYNHNHNQYQQPPPPGYGYGYGYGYNPIIQQQYQNQHQHQLHQQVQQPKGNNNVGVIGAGLGLGAGIVGGALVEHAITH
ncbi:protein SRC2 homolog [Solanum lycopersicum]|uniref:protein SRC2 homolog n=1 Tax=Solanum lycopersicum TaxID=4081 RepID=UPI003748CEE4